jgi:predicted dehydrogenase
MQQQPTSLPTFKNLAPHERIEKSISVALVGYGRQGEMIADALIRIPDVHVAAIADIWPWRRHLAKNRLRSQRVLARVYETVEELLDAETTAIDAVIVATPDWQHVNHVSACLKANKHVYCDGEISDSSSKAQELVKLASEKKLLVQCGHQRRSNPRYLYAIETLQRKYRIPDVVTHVYTQWHKGIAPLRYIPSRLAMSTADLQRHGYENMEQLLNWEWFNRFGLGDVAYRTGQKLDLLRWFWDAEPVSVTSLGSNDYYNRDALDFLMSIFTFKLPTGELRRGYVQVLSTNSRGGEFELLSGIVTSERNPYNMRIINIGCTCCSSPGKVLPEDGYTRRSADGPEIMTSLINKALQDNVLVMEKQRPFREFNSGNVSTDQPAGINNLEIPIGNYAPPISPHLENFISAIRDGTKLRDPIEQATKNLIALEAAAQSARERRTIDLV